MKINQESSFAIGADIGGSHITAALVDLNGKQLIRSSLVRESIRPNADVDYLIAAWGNCIASTMGINKVAKICIAMPGPFRYDEGVCLIKDQNKYPGLYGVNIKERLSADLNIAASDIYLHNDAACFLQGEVFGGSVTGLNNVIGITLGTGLGTATFKNEMATSADLWNMPFKDSIAEDYVSSRWFIQRYLQATGKEIPGVKELMALVPTEDQAREIFYEFGINLGQFLNQFIQLEHAEAVVIGGNISHAFPFFSESLLSEVYKLHPSIIIRQSAHGENASLIGAVNSWHTSTRNSLTD